MKKIIFFFGLLLFLGACKNNSTTQHTLNEADSTVVAPADITAEKEAIKGVLTQYVMANEMKNLSLLDQIWLKDSSALAIGTDNGEILQGYETIRATFAKQFETFENTMIAE